MPDNSVLPATGDPIRTIDRSGSGPKTQVMSLDIGPAGSGNEVILRGTSTVPDNQALAIPARMVGQDIWNCSFSNSGASVIAAEFQQTPVVGTGHGYSQATGNLLITTGTTVNSEFLARSVAFWRGSLRNRFSIVASQRIANQNFAVIIGDLIGEGLTVTVNSATAITVTRNGHGFTSQNVGQFVFLGGIVGLATAIPGRYAIASVTDANNFVLTVAGYPASGSFTATVFGHSHVKTLFTGVTATNAAWDTQRRGWAVGDTTLTINTTASPGTFIQNDLDGRAAYVADTLRANNATPNVTMRGSRIENLPDDNLDLYVFLWSYNGTVAPASTTTWTISCVSTEKFANIPVYIQGQRAQGSQNPAPVAVQGTVPVSGTVTANIGTGSIAAGTNAIGDVGVVVRATTPGTTLANVLSAATNNLTQLKASAGKIAGGFLTNTTASLQYVKLFALPSASVTMGTTAATTQIALQPNQTVNLSQGDFGTFLGGSGVTYAITTGSGLTDNTATTAGSVVGYILWV